MTHDEMAKQLKKAFSGVTNNTSQFKIKEEPEDLSETLYGAYSKHNTQRQRGYSPSRGYKNRCDSQNNKNDMNQLS